VSARNNTSSRLRIVVLGFLVRGPVGGMAWHHLQYLLGLARLGHHVTFIEDSGDTPWSCYDPSRGVTDEDPTYGLRFADRIMCQLGLTRWAYYDAHRDRWHGPAGDAVPRLSSEADVLVDLGLVNPPRPWTSEIPLALAVDTDPVFNQIRHLSDPERRAHAERYGVHFAFAERVGRPEAYLPRDGFDWKPTRQPVVLDAWPATPAPPEAPFTTVMQWDSYPALEHAGRRFGMKSDSFAPFFDLPRRTRVPLELALGSPDAPRAELEAAGWRVRNPLVAAAGPWTYRRYIRHSRGEFSVAKHGYVVANTGWFSERSANYLASGRPVVVQDTGFSEVLPTGEGLLAFSTADQAAAAVEIVAADVGRHGRAARELAREYFDSARVLTRLLEDAFANAAPARSAPMEARLGERRA
jgi:hypothetical protein